MKSILTRLLGFVALTSLALAADPQPKNPGRFVREHWAERGIANGNPNSEFIGKRLVRVNAPDVVIHPRYGSRSEPRSNGAITIRTDEDLTLVTGVELYCEFWGGHPGNTGKRVTLNGRQPYYFREVGAADNNCTHQYPLVPLKVTDLVNGYNLLQFAVDPIPNWWGEFMVEEAALRITLPPTHPDVQAAGLEQFTAKVVADPIDEKTEVIALGLDATDAARIASVEYQGHYLGYDENGDGRESDWHGFTKHREPAGIIGVATVAPFRVEWDTRMLPGQSGMKVRAIVRLKEPAKLSYHTAPLEGLRTAPRPTERVTIYSVANLPPRFWTRRNNKMSAGIELDVDPAKIVAAELQVVVWDGGVGTVKDYFTINGHPFPVAGEGKHDTRFSRLPVDLAVLRDGDNRIEAVSNSDRHGLEICLPGPALIVRSRR